MSFPPIQGVVTAVSPQSKAPFPYTFPGELNITENSYIPVVWQEYACIIEKLSAFVKTPAVGAAIILTFKKVTLATGVLSAALDTLQIAAGDYTNSKSVSIALAVGEALVMEVTQVGVATKGSDLTVRNVSRAA